MDKIKIIERRHPEITITVFGYNKDAYHLYKLINNKGNEKMIDLLLVAEKNKSHYVWVKDLTKLMHNVLHKNTQQSIFVKIIYKLNIPRKPSLSIGLVAYKKMLKEHQYGHLKMINL